MDFHLNSTVAAQATASYPELFALAGQNPNLSWLEKAWWTHYAYWDNDIIATGTTHVLESRTPY